MIIVPPYTLRQLMSQIVSATHGLVDENGQAVTLGTITEAQMRSAALTALQIASGGQAIWPGDQKIMIPRRRQLNEIFEESE